MIMAVDQAFRMVQGQRSPILNSPTDLLADHAAPSGEALGWMLVHPFGELCAPIRHDCIETSAKSDVVTVCS